MIIPDLQGLAVPIGTVRLDPDNARDHPDVNLAAIKMSLEKFGQRKPIVVTRDGVVIAGNGTLACALALGWREIAVVRVDDDEQTAAAYAIADNRSGELAEWNYDRLKETLSWLGESEEDAALLAATGFTDDELARLNWETDLGTAKAAIEGIEPNLDGIDVKVTMAMPGNLEVEVRAAVNHLIRGKGASWEKVRLA